MIRFAVAVVLMVALLGGVLIIEGFNPMNFLAFTPFVVTAGVPFCAALGVWGIGDLLNVFRDAFSSGENTTSEKSSNICVFFERLFYLAGIIGTLLGLSMILLRVDHLGTKNEICRAAAYSLLPSVYGILFAAMARIINARIRSR